MNSSRRRGWLLTIGINLLVAGVLLAAVLGAVELYLRVTIPESSGASIFESTLATKRYKVMKRNASIIAWGKEFRTNTLGFRDRQAEVPSKPADGFRIIVLGDSFTAAAGVDFDDLYTTRLERDIRRSIPNAEVMNLAVGGYNILQEELVLREVGLSLQPDMVVVAAFPFNDLSNDTYRANMDDAMGRSIPSAPAPAYERLYVYRAFISRVELRLRMMLASPATPGRPPGDAVDSGPSEAEQNLMALQRIVDAAAQNDLPVAIILLPNTDNFAAQRTEMAPFDRACESHGWHCLNLLDGFIASGYRPASMRLNLLDSHPNSLYHDLVARHVGEWLKPAISERRQGR